MYQIEINGSTYELEPAENRTAMEVLEMLPMRLSMRPYEDIEYYGVLTETPSFDEGATTTQAKQNALMYCRGYDALVFVCKDHHDIFREIPVGRIKGNPLLEPGWKPITMIAIRKAD